MAAMTPPSLSRVVVTAAKKFTPEDGPHLYSAFNYTAGMLIFLLTCRAYAKMLADLKGAKR